MVGSSKNQIKKFFNELLYMIIVVICYYILRKLDRMIEWLGEDEASSLDY